MCCANEMTPKDTAEQKRGVCPDCDNAVDEDGMTVEYDDCSYSPLLCKTCNYRPCDDSC